MKREPGTVTIGNWAHIRYHDKQHLIVANEPEIDEAEPVRFACGSRTFKAAVWHDPLLPHLPKCKRCLKSHG